MSSDKVYLITGASAGMGKATAFYLAQKGAKAVTLFARRQEPLEEVAAELKKDYPSVQTLVVTGNAAISADNKKAVDETVKAFGGLHGAFINAGAFRGGSPIPEISDDDIDVVINVNIKGVLYALRYAIPAIKTTVGEEGSTGSIVVNSSCMGEAVISPKSAGASVYSASKAFANSIVETAAIENAPRIRVNGVMPGVIQTSIIPGADDETYDTVAKGMQPLWGRAGKPTEVAAMVGFLLSDEASLISGTNIKVDGLWGLSGGSLS